METIKDRVLEKFVMTEFVAGRLNNAVQVNDMIIMLAAKRHTTKAEAGEFLRRSIGII